MEDRRRVTEDWRRVTEDRRPATEDRRPVTVPRPQSSVASKGETAHAHVDDQPDGEHH
jgi:hypothetical protein